MDLNKYLWTDQNLYGYMWARGVTRAIMDVHNQNVIDAVAAALRRNRSVEEFELECLKEISQMKMELDEIKNEVNK